MRDNFLPFSPPLIGEEEIAEIRDPLRRKIVGMTVGSRIGTHASLEMRYNENGAQQACCETFWLLPSIRKAQKGGGER